jgi:hypothetical protein
MNVNDLVKAYASGEVSKKRLRESFEAIGYSEQITDILMSKADGKKRIYDQDQASGVDPSKFFLSPDELWGNKRCPSGSLDGDGEGVGG